MGLPTGSTGREDTPGPDRVEPRSYPNAQGDARVLHVYTASMERTYKPEHVCHRPKSQPPVGGTLGPWANLSLQIHQLGANANADYERSLKISSAILAPL